MICLKVLYLTNYSFYCSTTHAAIPLSPVFLPWPIARSTRFATPKSHQDIIAAQSKAVPAMINRSTELACRIWTQWSKSREDSNCKYPPPPHLCTDESHLDRSLSKFILKVRKQDGNEYPPNTLYTALPVAY